MKTRIFVLFLFLIFSCFSISVQEALKKVNDLKITKIGENINPPTPLEQIKYGNKKYWVIEIDYGNEISLLVVVDNDGNIVYGNYAKDIMKIYYLNRYFYKKNPLKDFFDKINDKLVSIKTDLENRILSYNRIKKANNLDLDDQKCINYIKRSYNEIDETIKKINDIDYSLSSVSDIKKLNKSISLVFDNIKKFLNDLKTAKDKCYEYGTTLIEEYKNDTYYYQLALKLSDDILNLNQYEDLINRWNTDLEENKKIIKNMFEKLDSYIDQYYQMFLERLEDSKLGKEQQEKLEKLKEIQNLFNYIQKYNSFLKDYEIKKIQKIWEEYNKTYYEVLNYKFDNFDEKYKKIKNELEEYKKKIENRIKEYESSSNINQETKNTGSNPYILIGVLVLVLVGLVYLNKRKKKKNEDFEEIDFDPFKM